ncbi:hypothetical protein [Methylobacterium sp. yr668]|uniref:hypothetical protein n=1 Tax=Methylobacterium sp. yr668 TaxID=1761801 RepID=UPI0008E0F7D0|nr:hypothetical protein [Methylobacterium sp. yr668]SFT26918.1 hypothetical protein SAMN04487845_1379 [Methylobacterium sp. yr668]
MDEEKLPQETLSSDPQKAIGRLAHEVNRLNGQVAALLAYIEGLNVTPDPSRSALLEKAHEGLPPLLFTPGPKTYTDHARITLSSLPASDD